MDKNNKTILIQNSYYFSKLLLLLHIRPTNYIIFHVLYFNLLMFNILLLLLLF